ncbi:hypothetical protein BC831DRAFT_444517 [Entophlyctis helioformis]|nr:hypothetical protein BC831DRAFT_444517 [Entophlyctis helioformis]
MPFWKREPWRSIVWAGRFFAMFVLGPAFLVCLCLLPLLFSLSAVEKYVQIDLAAGYDDPVFWGAIWEILVGFSIGSHLVRPNAPLFIENTGYACCIVVNGIILHNLLLGYGVQPKGPITRLQFYIIVPFSALPLAAFGHYYFIARHVQTGVRAVLRAVLFAVLAQIPAMVALWSTMFFFWLADTAYNRIGPGVISGLLRSMILWGAKYLMRWIVMRGNRENVKHWDDGDDGDDEDDGDGQGKMDDAIVCKPEDQVNTAHTAGPANAMLKSTETSHPDQVSIHIGPFRKNQLPPLQHTHAPVTDPADSGSPAAPGDRPTQPSQPPHGIGGTDKPAQRLKFVDAQQQERDAGPSSNKPRQSKLRKSDHDAKVYPGDNADNPAGSSQRKSTARDAHIDGTEFTSVYDNEMVDLSLNAAVIFSAGASFTALAWVQIMRSPNTIDYVFATLGALGFDVTFRVWQVVSLEYQRIRLIRERDGRKDARSRQKESSIRLTDSSAQFMGGEDDAVVQVGRRSGTQSQRCSSVYQGAASIKEHESDNAGNQPLLSEEHTLPQKRNGIAQSLARLSTNATSSGKSMRDAYNDAVSSQYSLGISVHPADQIRNPLLLPSVKGRVPRRLAYLYRRLAMQIRFEMSASYVALIASIFIMTIFVSMQFDYLDCNRRPHATATQTFVRFAIIFSAITALDLVSLVVLRKVTNLPFKFAECVHVEFFDGYFCSVVTLGTAACRFMIYERGLVTSRECSFASSSQT